MVLIDIFKHLCYNMPHQRGIFMGIVYFNDIETQNAYIAKISNEIRENINDRKKISKKHDFYRTIAKKSWYMPLATAIAISTYSIG